MCKAADFNWDFGELSTAEGLHLVNPVNLEILSKTFDKISRFTRLVGL
jgi:hypothetical protein